MKTVTYIQVSSGFKKQFCFGREPPCITVQCGARAGDAFVLHNGLSQCSSLSDDGILAPAFAGRNTDVWKKRANLS